MTSRIRAGRALCWAMLTVLPLAFAAPRPARAQPSDAERKAAAQALFDEARKLTEGGDFAAACPKFTESRRLDPTMGTTFYLADCLEHVGKLASAWSYYVEVADAARAAGQADREAYARGRAEALRPRLPSLVVAVAADARGLAGLAVKRDGVVVGEAQWGAAIPVDPGEHLVSAAADGKAPWSSSVTVSQEGQTVTVEVPLLRDAAPSAPTAPTPPTTGQPAAPSSPRPAPPPRWATGQRVAAIAVGAAGVVGLGLGAIFGLQAMSKQHASDRDGHCDKAGYCDDAGIALRSEAIRAATVSTVGFIAGGVALAGGAALLLIAPSPAGEPRPASAALAASRRGPAEQPRQAPRESPKAQLAIGLGGVSVVARF